MILVGIDEAGYGPLIGPLVVTGAVFRLETPKKLELKALGVDDSKRLYSYGNLSRLETPVLAFISACGESPESIEGLLGVMGSSPSSALPWYRQLSKSIPLHARREEIEDRKSEVAERLRKQGISFCGFLAKILPADFFNQRLKRLGRKSLVLMEAWAQIVKGSLSLAGAKEIVIRSDHHGSRLRYAPLLEWFLGESQTIRESKGTSEYKVSTERSVARVEFIVDGDARFGEVALASMCSKYLREVFVEGLNAYWREKCPELPRTSGYYHDGHIFLEHLRTVLPDDPLISAMVRQK